MKNFAIFCAKKMFDAVYKSAAYAHLENEFDTDFKLFAKDLTFIMSPEINSSLQKRNVEEGMKSFKENYEKVDSFNKHKTKEKFIESDISLEFKLDAGSLQGGLSFQQLKKLSNEFLTEKMWVSGDGNDWEYSEYTSGHDAEVILKIQVENKQDFISQYTQWSEKLEAHKAEQKKSKINKKRI